MDICRSCMCSEISKLQSIFETQNISSIYKTLTLLNLSKDDGLPKWLCTDCVNLLSSFDLFKKQCINTAKLLKVKIKGEIKEETPEILEVVIDINDFKEENDAFNEDHNYDAGNDESSEEMEKDDESEVDDQLDVKSESATSEEQDKDQDKKPENINGVSLPDDEKPKIKPYQPPRRLRKKKFKPMEYDKIKEHAFYFRCYICNRGFRYKERYEGHLREHEGKRAAVCEFCNREYSEWSGLQKHINLAHKDEMKHICECGKKFMYESALNTHKLVHDGPREYVCEWCGKSFVGSPKLRKHMLVHTDETPFSCQLCGKKFKSVQRLRNHQIRHTDVRRFPCDVCGKAFTTRPELRTHFITHSGEKPYKCTYCDEYFRHKSQLYSHRKSHLSF